MGRLDNPLGLLQEVFLDSWYEFGGTPPSDATIVDIGANIGALFRFTTRSCPLPFAFMHTSPTHLHWRHFCANIERNQLQHRVHVYPEAVGRDDGVLE